MSFKEHQVLEAGAAEERFALSADVHCSHDGSGLPVRLYGGDLHIRGDLDSERKPPHWPAHVIVTGTSSSDRTTAEVIMAGGVLSYGLYARGAALAALGTLDASARNRTQRWVSSAGPASRGARPPDTESGPLPAPAREDPAHDMTETDRTNRGESAAALLQHIEELRDALAHAVRLLSHSAGREAADDPGQAERLMTAAVHMTDLLAPSPHRPQPRPRPS
ncbi:hypothetical protein AB0L80_37155 [Streptomyces sp. NPDC052069]|uniref:hypothetical protein n=1 Tax=Streptomyces sp. NPDC052069 TaxID=3154650 RepID=UPI00342E1042